MGTNYYAIETKNVCDHCGRGDEVSRIHIGKSSYGWCFGLHVGSAAEPEVPRSLDEWKVFLAKDGVRIEDEYDTEVTVEQMENIITQRKHPQPASLDWMYSNHAVPGPNGLARHALDQFCTAHGEGTYDLLIGYFR